jgi:type I restriction enzyme S subunit
VYSLFKRLPANAAKEREGMIEGLKPYAEYKESGSKWLGAVPTKWEVRNLRTLISKQAERDRPDLPLLSVAREKGVFVRSMTDADENHNVIPEDLTNYKVARAGNLVINKMKAWQGSMGIAPCDGIVSPAYFVFDFRIANHSFGQRLLRSKPYVAHFAQASDGVRVGQWDLSIPGMRQIPVLVPSDDEQAAIVRFLDHANRKIDGFIRAKRKLIGLLNEQKQAIIHRTVTRGIHSDVPLKPSCIPWLGDIPAHWGTMRLKNTCKIRGGFAFKTEWFRADGVPVIRMSNLRRGTLDLSDAVRISENDCVAGFELKAGDILYGLSGSVGATGSLGNFAVVATGDLPAQLNQRVARFRPDGRVLSVRFLVFLIHTSIFYDQVLADTTGTAQFNVSTNDVGKVTFSLPSISEQTEICDWLDATLVKPNDLIARTEREIALMQEYRTCLTADIVTGKLDVREASAKLPDLTGDIVIEPIAVESLEGIETEVAHE